MKHFSFLRHALVLVALCSVGHLSVHAQGVGIGTTAPDASAALDIVSTSKGALLPRVASTDNVSSPATGLIVFQTGGTPGYYYNSGTPGAPSWQQLVTSTQLSAVNTSIGILNAQTSSLNTSVSALNTKTTATDANVAALASSAVTSASNGLTKSGQNIALGGTLTAATTIAQAGYNFSLTDGNVGIGTTTPAGQFEVVLPASTGTAAIDQNNSSGASFLNTGTVGPFYQSFTAGANGKLQQLAVACDGYDPNAGFSGAVGQGLLEVFAGSVPSGTALASQAFTVPANNGSNPPLTLVTFAAPATVASGTVYCFRVSLTSGGPGLTAYVCTNNCYAGGASSRNAGWDSQFRTLVAPLVPGLTALLVNAGSVGIGTAAPSAILDVNGSTRLRGLTTAGLVQTDANGNLSSATAASLDPTTASNGLTKTANNFALGGTLTAATTIAQAGYNFSLTGGNVGIGTTTPLVPLSVNPSGLGAKITLWDANSTTQHYGFGISPNQLNYQVQGTADHVFSKGGKNNDGTEMVRLQGSTGNLGIGTAAPSALLDVNGSTRLRGLTTAGLVQTDANGNLSSATAASLDPTTASNGLTKTGNNFALGGTLTATTTIAQGGNNFSLTGGNVGIGTTAPAQRLDVTGGNIRIGTSGNGLIFPDGSTQTTAATTATGAGFIQNQTVQQATANFNISGAGTVGGALTAGSAAVAGALTGSGASITDVGVGIRADGGLNLGQNTTGTNLYVGYQAGRDNTTGTNNHLVGVQAGQRNTTGTNNFMEGPGAGQQTTTGGSNLFMGWLAGQQGNGDRNLAIGMQAGRANVVSDNQFVGFYAGAGTTTGSRNTFEGNYAGVYNISGAQNTFVGFQAGIDNSTGNNNFGVGYMAGPASGSGGLTNAGAIGSNARVSQSNSLVLGGTGTSAVSVGIGTTAPSSTLQVAGTVAVGVALGIPGGGSGGTALSSYPGGYLGLNPTGASTNNYFVLPDPATCVGRLYYLRNNSDTYSAYVGTAAGSIYRASSSTALASGASYQLPPNATSKMVIAISDGVNWTIGTVN